MSIKGMRMGHKGYDYFTPNPGEQEQMNCAVCRSKMDVRRAVCGPTSWAEAMGRSKRKHDEFRCQHSGKPWHDKALEIMIEAEDTASTRLKDFLIEEVSCLVHENLGRAKKKAKPARKTNRR